jgi:hypothetical protein
MTTRIRRDRERLNLRAMLLEGARSKPVAEADPSYFEALRRSPDAKGTRSATAKRRG